MHAKQKSAEEQATQLADVLAAAAVELQHAYDRGLRLEAAILQLLARNPSGPADLQELQHLDLVLQHVNAVGDFLAAIARGPGDPQSVAAALDAIKLSDVRDRLAGAGSTQTSPAG